MVLVESVSKFAKNNVFILKKFEKLSFPSIPYQHIFRKFAHAVTAFPLLATSYNLQIWNVVFTKSSQSISSIQSKLSLQIPARIVEKRRTTARHRCFSVTHAVAGLCIGRLLAAAHVHVASNAEEGGHESCCVLLYAVCRVCRVLWVVVFVVFVDCW